MEDRRGGTRTRVLVIDDDQKLGRLLARALAREHEVTAVTSAREALARIEAGDRFDLILCDLMMPGVGGDEFYERVGVIAPQLVERILIMTGGAYTPKAVAFLERASIRRLEKPFQLAELLEAVREHLSRLDGGRSG
jgi:DNA-binding NtrC family response regulator